MMLQRQVERPCSSAGDEEARFVAADALSYSAVDISIRSAQVSYAHSQIHAPSGITRLKPSFRSYFPLKND
jgi:hypothetical protein